MTRLKTAVPKPRKRAKRKPTRIARSPLKSSRKPVKKRNAGRRASEFARCYHSKERVEWVKSLPCVVCTSLHPIFAVVTGSSHNAHVANDGTRGAGRKSGFACIVPLCASHHRRFDEHQYPCDTPSARTAISQCAVAVEKAWRVSQGRGS